MSMADRDGLIWYDGQLVPWRNATTHVLTHSLHYGLAVFEGLRAYNTAGGPAIFRLREHTERLLNSAHIFMMRIPYDRETLMEAQREVVRANRFETWTGGRKRGQEDVASHERKGIAGDWRNHFTPKVAAAFRSRYGSLLVATGYERDERW